MSDQLKPAISVAEADLALSRAIEALKTARVMFKGPRPNWTAAGDFMSAARDMVYETYSPIIDAQVRRFQAERDDA